MFSPDPRDSSPFETILLDEARHRHANEFAAALAALHLVRAGLEERQPLIEEAIHRLEGGVRLERLLLNPQSQDLTTVLLELCSLIASTRTSRPQYRIKTLGSALMSDPREMRLFLLVAYELLVNAAKRSAAGARDINVRLAARPGELRLTVVNRLDGCHDLDRRVGIGGIDVLRQLVSPFNGRIACRREDDRFVAQAIFPVAERTAPASAGET